MKREKNRLVRYKNNRFFIEGQYNWNSPTGSNMEGVTGSCVAALLNESEVISRSSEQWTVGQKIKTFNTFFK